MKHQTNLEGLFQFLNSTDIVLNKIQQDQLILYHELLKAWSLKQNLVSKNDLSHLPERHFLPSIFMCTCLPPLMVNSVLDLGSGAGFPGMLIKIIRPELPVTLLDSSRKKTLFLQEVNDRLELGVKVVCNRCEIYAQEMGGRYQVVVARAVASIKTLLQLATPLFSSNGRLFTIKGQDYKKEVGEIQGSGWRYVVYQPDENWVKYGIYLKDKYVIELEK